MDERLQCTKCPAIFCYPAIAADQEPSFEEAPSFCPTKLRKDVVENTLRDYDREDVIEISHFNSQ